MLKNKTKTFTLRKTQGLESKTILYFITLLLGSLLFASSCGSGTGTQQACEGDNTIDPNNNCLPYTPENIEIKEIGDDKRILDWNDLSGIHSFRVQTYCSDNSVDSKDVTWPKDEDAEKIPSQISEMSINDLSQKNKQCHFRVRGCGQNGCGPWSITVSFAIGLPSPGGFVLSGEKPKPNTNSQEYEVTAKTGLSLAWNSLPNADSELNYYHLEEIQENGQKTSWQENIEKTKNPTLTYALPNPSSDLDFGQVYTYKLRSCGYDKDTNGKDICGPVGVLKIHIRLPAPVLQVNEGNVSSAGDSTDGTYTISWNAVDEAGSYELEESTDTKPWTPLSSDSSLTRHSLENLYEGDRKYRVKACVSSSSSGYSDSDINCSSWSSVFSQKTKFEIPQSLSLSALDGNSYTLSWSQITNPSPSKYQIQEASKVLNSSATFTFDASSTLSDEISDNEHSFTKEGSDWEKSYQYRVRACLDDSRCGEWSQPSTSMDLGLAKINSLDIQDEDNTSISVSNANSYSVNWVSVDNASAYQLQECPSNTCSVHVDLLLSASNATMYEKTNISYGQSYFYRVRACNTTITTQQNDDNCGDWSSISSVEVKLFAPANFYTSESTGTSNDGHHTLSWDSVADSTEYHLQVTSDDPALPSSNWGGDITVVSTTIPISNLSEGNYTYRLRSCLSGRTNCSNWTSNLSLKVEALAPPTLENADISLVSGSGGDDYRFDWSDVSGATSYEIEESIDGKKNLRIKIKKIGATVSAYFFSLSSTPVELTQTNLDCNGSSNWYCEFLNRSFGKIYSYKVKACSGDLCGDWSSTSASITILLDVASLSSDVPSGTSSDGAYNIIWPSVTGAGAYQLERSTDGGSNWTTLDNNGSTSPYTENNLGVGTYDYRVRACVSTSFSNNNCSAWASTLRIQVQALAAPSLNSNPTVVTTNSYTLNWDDVTGATSYEIEETVASDGNKAKYTVNCNGACTSTHSKRAYTGKAYGETYTYKVRTCDGNLCGALSSTFASFTILLDVASLSSDVPSGTSSDGAYNIIWPSVTGAGAYQLEKSTDGGSNWTTLDNNGSTSPYTENNLGVGTYDYRVRACVSTSFSNNNCSEWTSTLRIQVQALAAPSLPSSSTVVTTNGYTLNWDDVTGATSYEIEETVASDGSKAQYTVNCNGACTSTHSERAYTGKAYEETYTYKVRTCNGALCGDWSTTFASFAVNLLDIANFSLSTSSSDDGSKADYEISWDSVAGAKKYVLEESTDGGINWDPVLLSPDTATNHSFTNKEGSHPHKTYQYRVKACAEIGSRCQVNYAPQISHNVTLPPPSGLATSAPDSMSTSGSYSLSWDPKKSAKQYKLEESYDSADIGQSWSWLAAPSRAMLSLSTSMNTSFSVTGNLGHTQYQYQVRSCDSTGNVCGSPSALIDTEVLLPVLTDLQSDKSTSYNGSFSLSWDPPNSATNVPSTPYYFIEESDDNAVTWEDEEHNLTSPSLTLSDKAVATYKYRVRLCSRRGCGPATANNEEVAVNVINLTAPENFAKSGNANTYYALPSNPLNFTWSNVTGATAYQIQWKENSVSTWPNPSTNDNAKLSSSSDNVTWTSDTNTSYDFRIRSCIDNTCSTVSLWSTTILSNIAIYDLSPPTTLSNDQANNTDNTYSLNWSQIDGADSYILEESADGGSTWTQKYYGSSTSTLITQSQGGNYSYQVKACADHDSDTNTPSLCGTWYTHSTPIALLSNSVWADSGTGTPTDPYIISNYPQLKTMKYNLSASYKLANNIEAIDSRSEGAIGCTPYDPSDPNLDPSHANFDIENLPANLCTGWEPLGSGRSNPFTGTFDGNGYSIKNLFSYSGSGNSGIAYTGFFGYVSSPDGATLSIKDIGLKGNFTIGVASSSAVWVGGLVAYATSSGSGSIEITNSYTTGPVFSSSSSAAARDSGAGGLIGRSEASLSIANSYATGRISSSANASSWAGGLVGRSDDGSSLNIANSYATGDISTSAGDWSLSGGLVGSSSSVTITNSYATGNIDAETTGSRHDSFSGGLVGSSSSVTITNSYATGDVSSAHKTASRKAAGGIVGKVNSSVTISNSYFVDSDGASTHGIGSTDGGVTPRIIGDVSQKTFKELVFDMVETKTLASAGQSWSSTDDGLAWSNTHWDTTGYGLPCLKNMPNNPLQDCGFTGAGTSADPYIIKVYEQLKNMKYFLNSSYKLANNINAIRSRKEGAIGCTPYDPSDPKLDPSHANFDIENLPENLCTGWEPIGNCGTDTICKDNRYTPLDESQDNNLFTGTFDGNGYSIKNLFSYSGSGNSGDVYAGFFGYVSSTNNTTLSIKNIGLKDNFILGVVSSSAVWVGGLVGYATSSGSIEITNSYTTGDVFSSSSSSLFRDSGAGGLVGRAHNGSLDITNSYTTGRISSSASASSWAGGLVGRSDGGSSLNIANSYATGDIFSSAGDWSLSGGLVGRADDGSLDITNSYATGNIDAETSGSGHGSFSGGLVGSSSSVTITNSYATGDVSSAHKTDSLKAAGGIVGKVNSSVTISNSYFVDSDGASTHGIGSTGVTPRITNVHQATGTDDASRLTWMKDTLDETDNDGLNWDSVVDSDGNPIDPQPWGNLNAIGFPCLRNMPSGAPSCP